MAKPLHFLVYQAIFSAFIKAQFSVLPADVLEVANRYGVMKNYLYIRNLPVEYQPPVIHAYMEALSDVVSILGSPSSYRTIVNRLFPTI